MSHAPCSEWLVVPSKPNTITQRKRTMKTNYIATAAKVAACIFAVTSLLHAQDSNSLEKAKNVEKNIRQAEPPKVSTETKKSPVGLPASDFRPKQKPIIIKEPPPPVVTRSTTTAVSTSSTTAKSSSTAPPKN